jgi:hypothetical protein
MGEVPANADALFVTLNRCAIATGVVISKFDAIVNIVANGLNTRPPALNIAE